MRAKSLLVIVLGVMAVLGYYTWFQPFNSKAATADITASGVVSSGISITATSGAVSLGTLNGFTGAAGSADAEWTVKTNNTAGYELKVNKNHKFYKSPGGAGKEFDDYIAAGAPTYDWSVATDARKFGFVLKTLGASVLPVQRYLNDNTNCDIAFFSGGTFTSSKCWDSVPDTATTIASRSAATDTSGVATTITLKAEIGSPSTGGYLESGSYDTIITGTALTL